MLTDEQLEIFGDRMASLYQAYEQDVISDIARRVKKTGRYTETAELMAQQMYEAGMSPAKIQTEVMKVLRADKAYQDEVAQNTLEWKKYVKSEIEAMEADALAEGNMIIAEAGDMSFNYDMAAWERAGKKLTKDSAIAMLIEEIGKNTNETFKNLTNTMAFKGVYNMMPVQDLYIKSLDKAVLKMATGTFSFDQCVNDLVRELAQSGLRSVDYASGRTYQIDTAARMAIRTSCSQLAGKISMRNCQTTGTDLVEVSAHWGAREDHAVWQGKIYSISGKNKKYPDFAICRYGEVDGLKGINCRHDFYPFFEGISEPNEWPEEPSPKEWNGKTYTYTEATQKQRQMERNVRATKREIEAQNAIGGDTKALEAKKRRQISEYHEFSNAMEIRPKDNRLRVNPGSSSLTNTRGRVNNMVNNQALISLKNEKNSFSVNRELINSKGYHDKFTKLPVPKQVYESAYKQTGRLLDLSDGKEQEHMIAINARTGDFIVDNLSRIGMATRTGFSSEEYSKILECRDNIMLIHNHSYNVRPSGGDIVTYANYDNVQISLVACHDGDVYAIVNADKSVANIYEEAYNHFRKEFDVDTSKALATKVLYKENEKHNLFEIRRL